VKRLWPLGALVVTAAVVVAAQVFAALPIRKATFAWDKNGILRGTFAFRDALTPKPIVTKLNNGLPVTVVMRGYVYPTAGGDTVGLTAHSCRVAYDLWNEVYQVSVNGKSSVPIVSMKGVHKKCTEMLDLPIADRATLKSKPADYYLAVKVEVDPVSPQTLQKIQQWVTRPSGTSGSIGPGDALFASFVGVFMKNVNTASYVIDFQTDPFPP
jgi:archaellin